MRVPRWSKSFIIDRLILRIQIYKKIYKKYYVPECNLFRYDDFLSELDKKGINKDFFSTKEIMDTILTLQELKREICLILKKINPKLVVLQCWYGVKQMAFSLAAHELNIPVVEIQHGIAAGGETHPAYYNWKAIPTGGYGVMPDYMWVWDEYDYDAMKTWAKRSLRPFIGGHPMNLLWCDSKNSLNLFYQDKYSAIVGRKQKTILVSLQRRYIYPKWFIDYINSHDEYKWLIRLHPVVDKQEILFLEQISNKENIKKDEISLFPLEILLKRVDLHITMTSSVVLDAEVFKCPSIVLGDEAKRMYSRQISEGLVYWVQNREELDLKIKELLERDNCTINEKYSQELFEKGNTAIETMIDIINKVQ